MKNGTGFTLKIVIENSIIATFKKIFAAAGSTGAQNICGGSAMTRNTIVLIDFLSSYTTNMYSSAWNDRIRSDKILNDLSDDGDQHETAKKTDSP